MIMKIDRNDNFSTNSNIFRIIKSQVRKKLFIKKIFPTKIPSFYQGNTNKIFSLVDYFGEKFECNNIIDFGGNSMDELFPLQNKFKIYGICSSKNIMELNSKYKFTKVFIF